jgi:hypothetical protein
MSFEVRLKLHHLRLVSFKDLNFCCLQIGGGQYRSLPRDRGDGGDGTPKRGVVFGRATLTNDQPRCSSVPNLGDMTTNKNKKIPKKKKPQNHKHWA